MFMETGKTGLETIYTSVYEACFGCFAVRGPNLRVERRCGPRVTWIHRAYFIAKERRRETGVIENSGEEISTLTQADTLAVEVPQAGARLGSVMHDRPWPLLRVVFPPPCSISLFLIARTVRRSTWDWLIISTSTRSPTVTDGRRC